MLLAMSLSTKLLGYEVFGVVMRVWVLADIFCLLRKMVDLFAKVEGFLLKVNDISNFANLAAKSPHSNLFSYVRFLHEGCVFTAGAKEVM